MADYRIIPVAPPLYLVVLTPPIRGFDDFIGVWVHAAEPRFIVDTGPAVTADSLLAALAGIMTEEPDYILLTHIHMDHAGAVGDVAAALPDAVFVCHPRAIDHLVNPEKLQAGTIKTLGDTGRAYGPIKPVAPERLMDAEQFNHEHLDAILTPGHAPHHVSFLTSGGMLFAGEASGVNIRFAEDAVYMRPATPPRFKLETSVASLDRLIAAQPDTICYSHLGMRSRATDLLYQHREQLFFWKETIAKEMQTSNDQALEDRCAQRLLKTDPLLAGLAHADTAALGRETYFIKNSIQGIAGYLG
ncbi:MAG: MBL fold metallo-hydrolase [Thermodesulfobacteriota bacterium]|nr:MBL fold metallo-hydrolase [Thermodesulfobacteriota bacterium]